MHTYAFKQCGRWDLKICYQTPVKSSITDILHPPKIAKWGKNGANFENNSLGSLNNKLQDKPLITVTSDFLPMYVTKRNGITQLDCPASMFIKPLPAGTWTVIGNIANGYRPIADVYTMCSIAGNTLGILRIQTDGNVVLFSNVNITTSHQAFFSVLYL